MHVLPTEFSRVVYNAQDQAIEAQVTIRDRGTTRHYTCSVHAPISTPYSRTARELARRALRAHGVKPGTPGRQQITENDIATGAATLRRGLPLGEYGFFRGRRS